MEIKGGILILYIPMKKIRTKNININLQVNIFQTKKINLVSLFIKKLLQLKYALKINLIDLSRLFTFLLITS